MSAIALGKLVKRCVTHSNDKDNDDIINDDGCVVQIVTLINDDEYDTRAVA